jgi:hypothetical protein
MAQTVVHLPSKGEALPEFKPQYCQQQSKKKKKKEGRKKKRKRGLPTARPHLQLASRSARPPHYQAQVHAGIEAGTVPEFCCSDRECEVWGTLQRAAASRQRGRAEDSLFQPEGLSQPLLS